MRTTICILSHESQDPTNDGRQNTLIPKRYSTRMGRIPCDEKGSRDTVILGKKRLVHQHHRDGDDKVRRNDECNLDLFSKHLYNVNTTLLTIQVSAIQQI